MVTPTNASRHQPPLYDLPPQPETQGEGAGWTAASGYQVTSAKWKMPSRTMVAPFGLNTTTGAQADPPTWKDPYVIRHSSANPEGEAKSYGSPQEYTDTSEEILTPGSQPLGTGLESGSHDETAEGEIASPGTQQQDEAPIPDTSSQTGEMYTTWQGQPTSSGIQPRSNFAPQTQQMGFQSSLTSGGGENEYWSPWEWSNDWRCDWRCRQKADGMCCFVLANERPN
jgi:hypothetical protein